MKPKALPSCDDVLEAFALEPRADKATLEKYLRTYPDYAEAILDYSIEISREEVVRKEPPSAHDLALIATSWQKHVAAAPRSFTDPFESLSFVEFNKIAGTLAVPKQVLTALRDHLVVAASIPKRFAGRMAAELRTGVSELLDFVAAPPTLHMTRSRKSDAKPKINPRKTFEQVLADAGMSLEARSRLMAED